MKVRTTRIFFIFEEESCKDCGQELERVQLNLLDLQVSGWPVCGNCGEDRTFPEISTY